MHHLILGVNQKLVAGLGASPSVSPSLTKAAATKKRPTFDFETIQLQHSSEVRPPNPNHTHTHTRTHNADRLSPIRIRCFD